MGSVTLDLPASPTKITRTHLATGVHTVSGIVNADVAAAAGIEQSKVANLETDLSGKSPTGHNHAGVYEPSGAVAAHEAASDPHPGYTLSTELAAHEGAADPHTAYALDSDLSTHAAAADPHTGYQKESEKGAANGYPSLGAGGLVPIAQLASGTPTGAKFIRDDGTLQTPAGGASFLQVPIMLPQVANVAWTNMPAALSFWGSTALVLRTVHKLDLTAYTQVRLWLWKAATAGAAAAKLILRYKASPVTQTVADYSDIGVSEVSRAINVANTFLDTGWIDLAAGAKADVFVALVASGGDGALDPLFGTIMMEFK
jgi:hypothetical protein